MANLYDRLMREAKAAYVTPQRIDNVRHACPDCPTGFPRAFCPTCLGVGHISEESLSRWVRAHQ